MVHSVPWPSLTEVLDTTEVHNLSCRTSRHRQGRPVPTACDAKSVTLLRHSTLAEALTCARPFATIDCDPLGSAVNREGCLGPDKVDILQSSTICQHEVHCPLQITYRNNHASSRRAESVWVALVDEYTELTHACRCVA